MTSTPAGWYPDPSDPQQSQRYWDGSAWSAQTQPLSTGSSTQPSGPGYPSAPVYPPAPMYPSAPVYPPAPMYGAGSPAAPGAASLWQRNQLAGITVLVCIAYVLLAFYAHFVFIGVLPVLLTVRSFRRREPFAAVALVATVVAVGISLVALAH